MEGLKHASAHLIRFGGHKQAAGLTLKVENFEINYADAAEFTDPSEELEFDLSKAQNGLTTARAMGKKYLNLQRGATDEAIVEQMKANKESLSFLIPPETKTSISD